MSLTESWLVTASSNGETLLWSWSTHSLIGSSPTALPAPDYVAQNNTLDLAFNGQWVAVGHSDQTVRLWSITAPTLPPFILSGYNTQIDLAMSDDNHWLATTSHGDSKVQLIDLTVNKPTNYNITLDNGIGRSRNITFAPHSQQLIKGDEYGTVYQWDLSLDSLLTLACQTAGRDFTTAERQLYFATSDLIPKTCPLGL